MSYDPQKEISVKGRIAGMLERLKESEHRITPQRLAILDALVRSDGHPSAEDIYRHLARKYPTMSPATVYKTLALLKSQGEVLELEFSDLANRYDGKKPYPHPHVICTACGLVIDPSFLGLEDITSHVTSETGFEISSHRLDFYGICPDCQKKKPKKAV